MNSISIITDGAVQFSSPNFLGREKVYILPFQLSYNHTLFDENLPESLISFPLSASNDCRPVIHEYDRNQLAQIILYASQNNQNVLIILSSVNLSPLFGLIQEILATTIKVCNIHLIDSGTTSAGLGFLVEKAAELIVSGYSIQTTEEIIRRAIHQIYAIIAVPFPTYLFYSGVINRTQADICELLGIIPLFHLEDGTLIPVQKIRNFRTVVDNFLEFLEEFETINSLALILELPNEFPEFRQIHISATRISGRINYIEQAPSLIHATFFGPKAISLFAYEEV